MITLIAHHGIRDYEAWLKVVKNDIGDKEKVAQAGIESTKLYRTVDGAGVVVTHTFNDVDAAQNFAQMAQSPEFKSRTEKIGGAPPFSLWLVEEVEI